MNRNVKLWIGVVLVAAVSFGLIWANLPYLFIKDPVTVTLYSLGGKTLPKPDNEEFHDYSVLGKVKIESAEIRRGIVAAINAGVADSDGSMMKCFWPRHGVAITDDEKTLDFVVCFECLQIKRFDGGSDSTKATSKKREPFFDKLLTEAGVKLAPKR